MGWKGEWTTASGRGELGVMPSFLLYHFARLLDKNLKPGIDALVSLMYPLIDEESGNRKNKDVKRARHFYWVSEQTNEKRPRCGVWRLLETGVLPRAGALEWQQDYSFWGKSLVYLGSC